MSRASGVTHQNQSDFWLFSEGCTHCNVLFSVNPKKQRKDLNNEYFTINITQGNRLNQTGQPCSKVLTKYGGVLFGKKTKILLVFCPIFNTLVMIKFVGNYVWLITF